MLVYLYSIAECMYLGTGSTSTCALGLCSAVATTPRCSHGSDARSGSSQHRLAYGKSKTRCKHTIGFDSDDDGDNKVVVDADPS